MLSLNRLQNWRRLWLRLWLVYTLIAVVGVSLILSTVFVAFGVERYNRAYTQDNLNRFLLNEIDTADWAQSEKSRLPTAREIDAIQTRLYRFESSDPEVVWFSLRQVSDPVIEVAIKHANAVSMSTSNTDDPKRRAASSKRLLVDVPIPGSTETARLVASVDAPFEFSKVLRNQTQIAIEGVPYTLFVSAILGLLSSLVAARYVTRRLAIMNDITAKWRLGDFEDKIELGTGDELAIHADRLNAMASELETHLNLKQALAVSDERTRIARDLHDTIKQKLFALSLQLGVIKSTLSVDIEQNSKSAGALNEAQLIAQEAQHDLVAIIDQLNPANGAPESFGQTLRSTSETLERRLSTKFVVKTDEEIALPPQTEIALLRVVRELATNAVRHGRAKQIHVDFRETDQKLCLSVSDDGRGFDPNLASPGLGLTSVGQSVASLPGGALEVFAQKERGAMFKITWDAQNV